MAGGSSATHPTAYHTANCTCGEPEGEMTIDAYLRRCFLKRLQNKESLVDGSRVGVPAKEPKPVLCEVIDDKYVGTELHGLDERSHPLLCKNGHYSWDKNQKLFPRRMLIDLRGHTISEMRAKLERGETVDGAHFKHWRLHPKAENVEKTKCHCNEQIPISEEKRLEIRNRIYGNRKEVYPCLYEKDQTIDFAYFLMQPNDDYPGGGWLGIDNEPDYKVKSKKLDVKFPESETSIWIKSNGTSKLPSYCYSLEYCGQEKAEISLQEEGSVILLSKNDKSEIEKLKRLRQQIGHDNVIASIIGEGSLIQKITSKKLIWSKIAWDNSDQLEEIKKFIQSITGLKPQSVRRGASLEISIMDDDYNEVTCIDRDNLEKYAFDGASKFYLRIRRKRNKKLNSFYLSIGNGINLDPQGSNVEVIEHGKDNNGNLWNIYVASTVDKHKEQRALWLEMDVGDIDTKSSWIEVFDYGSTPDQSGQRIEFVRREDID